MTLTTANVVDPNVGAPRTQEVIVGFEKEMAAGILSPRIARVGLVVTF